MIAQVNRIAYACECTCVSAVDAWRKHEYLYWNDDVEKIMLTTIRFDQGFREWNLTKKCIPIVVVSSAGSCIKKAASELGSVSSSYHKCHLLATVNFLFLLLNCEPLQFSFNCQRRSGWAMNEFALHFRPINETICISMSTIESIEREIVQFSENARPSVAHRLNSLWSRSLNMQISIDVVISL